MCMGKNSDDNDTLSLNEQIEKKWLRNYSRNNN